MLAQEFVRDQPWQLLVVCVLLNQTDGKKQVKPMLADFFERYPSPESFLAASESDIKQMIRPLGLQNIRYKRLVGLSKAWIEGVRPPDKLPGVGKYAMDSYTLFVEGYLVLDVQDKELKKYVRWAREEGTAARDSGPGRVQLRGEEGARVPDEQGREGP